MGDGERVNLRKKVTEVLGGWRWARSGRSKAESLEESSVSWCDNQSKVWVESAFEREPLWVTMVDQFISVKKLQSCELARLKRSAREDDISTRKRIELRAKIEISANLKHKLGREAMHFAVYPPERVQALRPRFDHMLH